MNLPKEEKPAPVPTVWKYDQNEWESEEGFKARIEGLRTRFDVVEIKYDVEQRIHKDVLVAYVFIEREK